MLLKGKLYATSKVTFNEVNKGGLNIIDVCSFEKYMKITWLKSSILFRKYEYHCCEQVFNMDIFLPLDTLLFSLYMLK